MSRATRTRITPCGSVDTDYIFSYVSGILTITPAALLVTANNQTKLYGAAVPTLTASYIGFVNGDSSASLTTLPTLTTTANVDSKVAGNPYPITASGAVDSNYTISYVAGILTVTPAPLTITANNQTKVYGAALPTLTVSYSGFVNGDTTNNLTTQPTITTTATASSHVSGNPYAITASGAVDPDYTISYVNGTLNVTPAALLITANNQTKLYGAALPALDDQLHRVRQWRHLRQPHHPAHADDHGHGRAAMSRTTPTRSPPAVRWIRTIAISYRLRHAECHAGGPVDHRQQPDQGLRRRFAGPDGQLHVVLSTATVPPA